MTLPLLRSIVYIYFWLFFFRQCHDFIFSFLFFLFDFILLTILYWFCHTSTWIRHGCTWVPNPETPSHLPPHNTANMMLCLPKLNQEKLLSYLIISVCSGENQKACTKYKCPVIHMYLFQSTIPADPPANNQQQFPAV